MNTNKSIITTAIVLWIVSSQLWASDLTYQGTATISKYSGGMIVDNSQFSYPSIEKLTFNTADYLAENHPHLQSLRPAIDTWAAMQSIHPKLLAAVIDNYQAQLLTPNQITKQTVFEIAAVMSEIFYHDSKNSMAASIAIDTVAQTFGFTVDLPSSFKSINEKTQSDYFKGSSGPPLYGYLQPPWPRGEEWSGGGVHGNSVKDSLDFWGSFTNWGGNTSNDWVSAAQVGVARVWSSCGMTVIHPNGWETFYYHLDNIQVDDMDDVVINERISNYANNIDQALCQGGGSSGPHIHMSIKYDGSPVAIKEANLDFTSWKHHAGEGNYDGDCERSYYTLLPSQSIVCPFWRSLPNTPLEDLIYADGFE